VASFDADDVLDLRKAQCGSLKDRRPYGRERVHDLRNVHLFRDGAEVRYRPSCVACNTARRKTGIGAGVLADCVSSMASPSSCLPVPATDSDAAARVGDGQPDQFLVLVEIDGGRFPRGADDDNTVGACSI